MKMNGSKKSETVRGLIPSYMTHAGFTGVAKTIELQPVFGTIALYKGEKPK
jgi:hypothetical protein